MGETSTRQIKSGDYDEQEILWWECKYCGQNEYPRCHKCVRTDGIGVEEYV